MPNITVLALLTDGTHPGALKASLESWNKYGPKVDAVMILGEEDALEDLTLTGFKGAHFATAPVHTRARRPRLNEQRGLTKALEMTTDDAMIIWAHERTYPTRPVTLGVLSKWSRAERKVVDHRQVTGADGLALKSTQLRLERSGFSSYDYELHAPLVIEPEERKTWQILLDKSSDDLQMRTWVLNQTQKMPTSHLEDVEVYRIYEKPQHAPFATLGKNVDHFKWLNRHG